MKSDKKPFSSSGGANKALLRLLILLILLSILLILFPDEIRKILQELQNTRWQILVSISFLALIRFITEGAIIRSAVRGTSEASCCSLSLKEGILCAFYCEFFRLFTLGSGSGVAEIYYLSQHGLEPARGTGLSLIQYIIHKLTITLYGIMALFLCRKELRHSLASCVPAICGGCILALGICLAILLAATWKGLSDRIFFIGQKTVNHLGKGWPEKWNNLEHQVTHLQEEARLLLHEKKRLLHLFLLNLLKFGCLYMIPWITFTPGFISPGKSWLLCALIYLLAGVIPAPSGYGSTEFLFLLLYSPFTGTGQAGAAAVLLRIVTSIFPALIGGIVYLLQKNK